MERLLNKIELVLGKDGYIRGYDLNAVGGCLVSVVIVTDPMQQWDDHNLKERFSAQNIRLLSYSSVAETEGIQGEVYHTNHIVDLLFDVPSII